MEIVGNYQLFKVGAKTGNIGTSPSRPAELLTVLTAIFWQFFFCACSAIERQ